MDALFASAQIWVPAAGFALLLLMRAWLACLNEARGGGAVAAYFVCLGLASVAPVAVAIIAWSLYGVLAQWGPLVLLSAPATMGEQHVLLASLLAPALVFMMARFFSVSGDAISYAAAAAAAFAFAPVFSPPVVIAIAVALGGLAGFADRMLGKIAAAMAAVTGFALVFGILYGGGGAATPLIALTLIGGLCLSLIGAGGKRARIPFYVVLTALPGFALAAALRDGGGLDLAQALPKPATGNYAALVVLFAILPSIAAPFAAVPIWFWGRAKLFLDGEGRLWIAPFALFVTLLIGLVLSVASAIALAAGSALFSQLHEVAGGATLLQPRALIAGIQQSPLASPNWWVLALLALPIAPALVQMFQCATSLFMLLLTRTGLSGRLDKAIESEGTAARLFARTAGRILQLAPSALILFALILLAPFVAERHGTQIAETGDALIALCDRTAQRIEAWHLATAALCPADGPQCR